MRWQIDLLDGGTVRPDSGNLTRFEGVVDQANYDINYWHPDGAPAGQPTDLPTSTYGFPHLPGLLDASRRPFEATGLRTPWLSVFGNHDGLVQGTVPSNPIVAGLATGPPTATRRGTATAPKIRRPARLITRSTPVRYAAWSSIP